MSKKINIAIYLFATLIIIIVLFMYNDINKKKVEYDKTPVIVKNFDDFYTISNCIDKYLNYVKMQDKTAVLNLLTKRYKEDNHINEKNIFNKINLGKNPIFISKKMLYKHTNENEYKYYVYGIQKDFILNSTNGYNEENNLEAYYILYINMEQKIFSIEPYDGKDFIKGRQ